MRIDSRTIPPGETVQTEICIVGGGPAGLTLAHELAGADVRVCVLESGAETFDAAVQALCAGQAHGDPYYPLEETRRRQLGGTAHLWNTKVAGNQTGLRLRPLDPIDFSRRSWLPHSGWPFDYAHLDPYYRRAQTACGLGPYAYDGLSWAADELAPLTLSDTLLTSIVYQFAPTQHFVEVLPRQVEQAKNVTVFLYASVVEIETDETGRRVQTLRVARPDGTEFRLSARTFVLAAGGIENARLLLLSNQAHAAGLGNTHDLVGRFFMEHPHVYGGVLVPRDRQVFERALLYDVRQTERGTVMAKLRLPEETLRREQLLNSCTMLFPRPRPRQTQAVQSFRSLAELARARHQGSHLQRLSQYLRYAWQITAGMDYLLPALYRKARRGQYLLPHSLSPGWSYDRGHAGRYVAFELVHILEQSPDPENRVVLSDTHDHLGRRRADLRLRLHARDAESARRTNALLAKAVEEAGFGRLLLEPGRQVPEMDVPNGAHHHLGTTRMHDDPKQGVVDANGKVHDLANLYVTGGSIFPTGGFANPTFTVVALAIRLADHLRHTAPETIRADQGTDSSQPTTEQHDRAPEALLEGSGV